MQDSIQQHMFADHDRLNGLFQQLADTVEGADAPTIQEMWTEFESGLMAHLAAEEKHLFPLLVDADPDAIRALSADHERIRALVAELGVRSDLHTLRKQSVDGLIELLRRHADREAELLYRRADELMDARARREAIEWMADERRRRRSTPGPWEMRPHP